MNLIVAESIEHNVAKLRESLPSALLLCGEPGVGLMTLAKYLAGDDIEAELYPVDKDDEPSPYGTVSIESIRKLYDQTRGKTRNRQVIVIDDADKMSHNASNALLKLLEEPPRNTHFILTSHDPNNLLPTVRSRLQKLVVPRISSQQTTAMISDKIDEKVHRQLEFMALGRPAELSRLMTDPEYFDSQSARFSEARVFLQAGNYEKIILINKLSSQRAALEFCDSVLAISRSVVSSRAEVRVVKQIESLLKARERIAANGNIKLNMLRAML